jgi:hypothetical protein
MIDWAIRIFRPHKEQHMKLKAALVAAVLGVSMAANAAVVDPAEPPATPAGGNPEGGINTATAVGIAIGIGVIVAIAGGGGNGTSGTSGTTGTN